MASFPGTLDGARGAIALHADWPAYPEGGDFHESLIQLSAFPPQTEFILADDIDETVLLVANVSNSDLKDMFCENNFHISLWHEDLKRLHKLEYLEGVDVLLDLETEISEWEMKKLEELIEKAASFSQHGCKKTASKSGLGKESYPNSQYVLQEKKAIKELAFFMTRKKKKIMVTNAGRSYICKYIEGREKNILKNSGERIARIFEMGYYDTSVREACVQLESEIRKYVSSGSWGNNLVREYISKLRREEVFIESYVRNLGQELRTLFKFIRNDYMHNMVDTDRASALTIMYRVEKIKESFDRI